MAPISDVVKPSDDPYSLLGENWPVESESAYHVAETVADDGSATATTQAQSAAGAESKMTDERGRTAERVSDGYGSAARGLQEQSRNFTTISAWMVEAAGKIRMAKNGIANLVHSGTQEIRDALNSELAGTPVTPSSTALTDKYRNDITAVASKLNTDLDNIGHSLAGDPGASRSPTYVRAAESSITPTVEQAAVHHSITGEGPHAEPHQLPEMPRATSPSPTESPSGASTPSAPLAPHVVNPTLANLVGGGEQSAPSPSAKSSSTTLGSAPPSSTPSGTPAGQNQAHQPNEQRQQIRPTGLPRIPSVALPDLPAAAADIATAVTSATAHQLPTAAPSAPAPSVPASTGFTPGTPPVTPGLAPIGGGLPTPPVVQTPPVSQGTPATSPAAPTPSPQAPAPAPRGPAADLGWIQRTYGLSPSLDLPKPENPIAPARFIIDLSEEEAHLHRVLATLRQQFEAAGWSQPLAVATIRRGFETRTVYVTADGLSIHPSGVRLPSGVNPLDEMPSTPSSHDLDGSLMVTDKLRSLIPREWTVEQVLSTVSGGEGSQSAEEYQELVESGELLECTAARGRDDVGVDEALRMFARAALGSGGCGELGAESARLRAARWVGVQPQGYLDVLGRWYLADAAEAMSRGSWGEAVYSAEKYMFIRSAENKAA